MVKRKTSSKTRAIAVRRIRSNFTRITILSREVARLQRSNTPLKAKKIELVKREIIKLKKSNQELKRFL